VQRGNPPSCHCENCKAIRGNLIQHNLFFRIPNIVIARSTKCNAAIPLLVIARIAKQFVAIPRYVIARIAKQFVAISFNITYSFIFINTHCYPCKNFHHIPYNNLKNKKLNIDLLWNSEIIYYL